MSLKIEAGTIPIIIGTPFTLRELAGPWSWIAIRYYWFVYDELMAQQYAALVARGQDPIAHLMQPAAEQLAGNVELALEHTELGFRIVSASQGSIVFEVSGAWKALKALAAWLPIYGKWLQQKGQIDIRTEVERSEALVLIARNFQEVGIPEQIARQMAFHRLYSTWPQFYADSSRALEAHMSAGEPRRNSTPLAIQEETIRSLIPPREQTQALGSPSSKNDKTARD